MASTTLTYLIFGILAIALLKTSKSIVYADFFGFMGRVGLISLLVVTGFFVPFTPDTSLFWLFIVTIELVAYLSSGAVKLAATVIAFVGIFSLIMGVVRGI